MKIDEAITHAREIAEKNRQAMNFESEDNIDDDIKTNCLNCATQHEQLADWLEELKMLRELKNEHRKVGNIEGYNAGYKKAIDDFERKLISHLSDWSEAPFNDDETDRTRETICETIENAIGAVEEIAEQLKEGGAEE